MDSFNKKVRDELSQNNTDIPEGMSWDEMAPGIMAKMPKKKRKSLGFWIFFIALFTSASAWFIVQQGTSNFSEKSAQNISVAKQDESSIILHNNENSIQETPIENNKTISIEKKFTPDNTNTTLPKVNTKTASITKNTTPRKIQENLTIERNSNTSPEVIDNLNTLNAGTSLSAYQSVSSTTNDTENVMNFSASESIINLNGSEAVSSLQSIGLALLPVESFSVEVRDIKLPPITNPEKSKSKLVLASALSVSAGYVSWKWGIKNSDFDISQVESSLPSYRFQVNYEKLLLPYLGIRTGAQYTNYRSVLKHTFINVSQEYDPSVSSPVYNVLTRKTTTTSPGVIKVTKKRKVIAYNQMHTIGIPVELFVQKNLGRFSFLSGLATSVQFLASNSGSSADANSEFINLSDNSSLKSFLGFTAGGNVSVNYRLLNKYSVFLHGEYAKSLSDWANGSEDVRKPSSYFIGFGVKRGF